MEPVIEIRNLSKQYALGEGRRMYGNLREVVASACQKPWSALRGQSQRQQFAAARAASFWALRDVSFDVNQGDTVAILGSNGAGKSTLLKVLSRITEPTSGSARVRGRAASLLEVGTGFHPELTGRENIYLNGAILGMHKSEIDRKFDEIVDFAGVNEFLDTPVKRFSSGMYVRLAFSIAAHLDPEILIVDEVLAVGDVAFQKKCLGRLAEACTQAKTVLFVSHNLAIIENICNRAVVLQKGRLVFNGTAREGIQYYLENLVGEDVSTTSHQVDLTCAPGRPERYQPQLELLELYTADKEPVNGVLPVGSALRAVIQVNLAQPSTSFDASIAFDTLAGQRICTAHSAYEPNRQHERSTGRHTFVCEIPSLPLLPGEYKVSVGLDITNAEADWVDDAMRLTILKSDFYGTGVIPTRGVFLMQNRWKLGAAKATTITVPVS